MKLRVQPPTKKTSFRSGLEERIAKQLESLGVSYGYEHFTINYIRPAKNSRYTPDFSLPNGIIIEAKGRFLTKDRQKHLQVKAQYPKIDIRFVFSNPNQRISKISKTKLPKLSLYGPPSEKVKVCGAPPVKK